MPSLTDVYFDYDAFEYKDDVTIIGGTHFIPLSRIDIGHLFVYFDIFTSEMYEYCINLLRGSNEVTDLVIGSSTCLFANVTLLDLSVFPSVKTLSIGSNALTYVSVLNITGLSELESVEIGMNSFTKEKNSWGNVPNRHFYLKDCPKLRSLKIGFFSFSDYSVIEIENVDALEEIEMGEVNVQSYNFYWASLELKSILIHSE